MIEEYAKDVLNVLYYHSSMCFIVANDDWTVLQCNPATCSILERNEESMVGASVDSLAAFPLDEAQYEGMLLQLNRDGFTSLSRRVFKKADGAHIPLLTRVLRVNPDLYCIILFPDQDVQLNGEVAALQHSNNELIRQVLDLEKKIGLMKKRKAFPLNVTPTERKIAAKVARGKTSEEIAEELHRSAATVKNHRKALRKKLKLARGHSLLAALQEYGLY